MDPVSVLVLGGAVGALSSLASAVASYVLRKRTSKVKIKIGGTEIEVSTKNRAEVQRAVDSLQQILDADVSKEK
jgi:hypothetical protein